MRGRTRNTSFIVVESTRNSNNDKQKKKKTYIHKYI